MTNKYIKELTISGFRGFSQERTIQFAIPQQGKAGSGLTFLVGANNSGKSSIIECIRLLTSAENPSISIGQRNNATAQKVLLQLLWNDESLPTILETIRGSETTRQNPVNNHPLHYIPSRRRFESHFGKADFDQRSYMRSMNNINYLRRPVTENFAHRLQAISSNETEYEKFNNILSSLLGETIEWYIELEDSGQHSLRVRSHTSEGLGVGSHTSEGLGVGSHTSEGLGDGIVSIFFIVNAFLESEDVVTFLIDEPELSLHPSIKKRLLNLLKGYSQKKQITIATHCPYFLDFESIFNGALLHRIYKEEDSINIGSLTKETVGKIRNLCDFRSNPHIFGLDARAIFFLPNSIILVEGQEDVMFYPKIAEALGEKFQGEFYGWGAGGAGNFKILCRMFQELGYSKVFCILDKNKEGEIPALKNEFQNYSFCNIPTHDIRDKKDDNGNLQEGLVSIEGTSVKLKPEHIEYLQNLIKGENKYMLHDI